MQLYFIRHAQSENNAHIEDENYQESHDPLLTKLAYDQIDHLVGFLKNNQRIQNEFIRNPQNRHGFGITHLYTSLMVRAVRTAYPISNAVGLPLYAWPEIHETGGIFSRAPEEDRVGLPGKSRSFFESTYPNLILPEWLDESGWWQKRPFEMEEMRVTRAKQVWADLLAKHGDMDGQSEHRVAMVSHGGFFMYLLATALNIELHRNEEFNHQYWFLMNNCGITRLDVSNDHVQITYINRTDFLPDYLIT
jgi:2,3-bisphosphoglycerate-dependent phosphoglycerate mutase